MKKLTQDRLKELFHYDPDTGMFTRLLCKKRGSVKAGSIAGCRVKEGNNEYFVTRVDGILHRCHRLAWLYVYGEFPAGVIDHINQNGLDNRIKNLRDVSIRKNQENRKVLKSWDGSSKYVGVHFCKRTNRWRSTIMVNRKNINLGRFDTEEEAHQAYLEKKRKVHEGCTI